MRPFVACYDAQFQAKDYDGEAAKALAFLGLGSGAAVLEIGAGTGGHSLAFARRGCTVTAVEIDAEMAEAGHAKTTGIPAIRWHVGSAETAPAAIADGACALFYVVNYVRTRPDLVALFDAVHARLSVGGRLTFDCWNGLEAMCRTVPMARRSYDLPGGGTLVQEIETRVDSRRQEADLIYRLDIRPAGQAATPAEERLTIRLWTRREIEEALEAASFQVTAVRDGRAPEKDAEAGSARLWFTAEAH